MRMMMLLTPKFLSTEIQNLFCFLKNAEVEKKSFIEWYKKDKKIFVLFYKWYRKLLSFLILLIGQKWGEIETCENISRFQCYFTFLTFFSLYLLFCLYIHFWFVHFSWLSMYIFFELVENIIFWFLNHIFKNQYCAIFFVFLLCCYLGTNCLEWSVVYNMHTLKKKLIYSNNLKILKTK